MIADLTQFIDEFSVVLSNVHAMCNQAYMNGDYNINLLQLNTNNHYNAFYENVTSQGFFPKISRPTRSFENSHSLIDNIFSNNLCKPHISGILTHHISGHFMNFCIVENKDKKKPISTKYIGVENVNPTSVANFKNCVAKSELIFQLDNNPYADPNHNYSILSSVIEKAKDVHIPKKIKKINVRKHFRNPWMTNELLTLINRKNDLYREWKSTSNDIKYENKKVNFKKFEKIVHDEIKLSQSRYYLNSITAKKRHKKKPGPQLMKL